MLKKKQHFHCLSVVTFSQGCQKYPATGENHHLLHFLGRLFCWDYLWLLSQKCQNQPPTSVENKVTALKTFWQPCCLIVWHLSVLVIAYWFVSRWIIHTLKSYVILFVCDFFSFYRKQGDGLFLKTCEQVSKLYPKIKFEGMIVDNTCMQV